MFAFASDPNVISLATGWPSPDLYPTEELAQIARDVLDEEGGDAITYLTAPGLDDAARAGRRARAARSASPREPEEILVTSGARQAIDLRARAGGARRRGAVESPTYAGLLRRCGPTGARVIGVPVDAHGLDVDALEQLVGRHEVKLVALQSGCQNPTGRRPLARAARAAGRAGARAQPFVLEDGVYGDLRFDGAEPRALRGSRRRT